MPIETKSLAKRGMSKQSTRIGSYLRSLIDVRAIILGLALLHLVVTTVWLARWYQALGNTPVDAYPDSFLIVPLLLVFASLLLLIGRWWARLVAFLISAWMLYRLGYAGLSAAAAAHDRSLFAAASLRLWFTEKYIGQPQEFLQLALAFMILFYVLVVWARQWRGRSIKTTSTP